MTESSFLRGYEFVTENEAVAEGWDICHRIMLLLHGSQFSTAIKLYQQLKSENQFMVAILKTVMAEIIDLTTYQPPEETINSITAEFISLPDEEQHLLLPLLARNDLELSLRFLSLTMFQDKIEYYQTILTERQNDEFIKIILNYFKGKLAEKQGRLDHAMSQYQSVIQITDNLHWIIKCKIAICICQAKLGDLSKAERGLAELLMTTSSSKFTYFRTLVLNNLSIISTMRGNPVQSKQYANMALELSQSFGFIKMKLSILHNQASNLFRNGEYRQALTIYHMIETMRQEEGDTKGYLTILNSIGASYARIGELEEARQYYRRALDSKSALDIEVATNLSLNFTDLLIQLGHLKEAAIELDEISYQVQISKSQDLLTRYQLEVTKLAMYQNSHIKELETLKVIADYLRFEGKINELAKLNFLLAQTKELLGEIQQSKQLLKEAIDHARYTEDPIELTRFLFYQFYLHLSSDEHQKSLKIFREVAQLNKRYSYRFIDHYLEVMELMLLLEESDVEQRISMLRDQQDIWKIVSHPTISHKLREYFLLFLLDIISALDLPNDLQEFYLDGLDLISSWGDLSDSVYLRVCYLLYQARYLAKIGDNEGSKSMLELGKSLAADHGYSGKMNQITFEQLKNTN